MNSVKVTPEQVYDAVMKAFAEYGDELMKRTTEAAKSTGRQTASALKTTGPQGVYKAGWSHRGLKDNVSKYTDVVYNRQYQLVHLQENPHATGGGKNAGSYPRHVDYTGQIARIEEQYKQVFLEEVMARL